MHPDETEIREYEKLFNEISEKTAGKPVTLAEFIFACVVGNAISKRVDAGRVCLKEVETAFLNSLNKN